MPKELTEKGISEAAKELGVEPAVIKAVAEVESAGDGFLHDGRVKILFERHKFHKYTDGNYDKDHPDISNPQAGGYGAGGEHQNARFSEAFELDPEAAMMSASWGKFQIMGFNYKAAGFDTVGEFVDAMKEGEDQQLKAFVKLIKSWGLGQELRNHDWAGFARQYNGGDYKKNHYDTKLAVAYEKFKHDPVEPEHPKTETPTDASVVITAPTVQSPSPIPVEGGGPQDPPKPIISALWSRIYGGIGGLGAALVAVKGFLSNHDMVLAAGVICLTLIALSLIFRKALLDYLRMQITSDPNKINVK